MKEKAKLFQVTTENANNRTSLLDEIVVPIRLVASSWYLRFCMLHRSYIYSPLPHKLALLKLLTTSEIQHWCSIPKGHGDRKIVVLLTWVNL